MFSIVILSLSLYICLLSMESRLSGQCPDEGVISNKKQQYIAIISFVQHLQMPAQSCPEVFNSRGRVAPVGSSPAPGDSRISVSSTGVNLQAVVASLMQDVKTGAPIEL